MKIANFKMQIDGCGRGPAIYQRTVGIVASVNLSLVRTGCTDGAAD
jgi:hypothetical protein